jgi:hypothetical protein
MVMPMDKACMPSVWAEVWRGAELAEHDKLYFRGSSGSSSLALALYRPANHTSELIGEDGLLLVGLFYALSVSTVHYKAVGRWWGTYQVGI